MGHLWGDTFNREPGEAGRALFSPVPQTRILFLSRWIARDGQLDGTPDAHPITYPSLCDPLGRGRALLLSREDPDGQPPSPLVQSPVKE